MPKIIRPFSCCTCTHFDGGYTVLAVKCCSCTYIQYSGVQTVLWKCNRVKAYVRLYWDTHSLPAASGKCDCTSFSAKYRYSIDPRKRSAKGDQSAVSDAESRCGKKKEKNSSAMFRLTVEGSFCHPADRFYSQDSVRCVQPQFRSVCIGWLCKLIYNLMGSDKTLARVHSRMIRAHRYNHNMLLR